MFFIAEKKPASNKKLERFISKLYQNFKKIHKKKNIFKEQKLKRNSVRKSPHSELE